MCRLFGMTAGAEPVKATFWLLDAPDSLEAQSRRNVDGSGIGFFDEAGLPVLDKQPEPAYSDVEFGREAKQAESATFVAHVRLATAGGRTARNTHPFAMHGRIMAHNGGFGELARLDEQLGPYRDLVLGDTDSERYFALITQQADARGGPARPQLDVLGARASTHLRPDCRGGVGEARRRTRLANARRRRADPRPARSHRGVRHRDSRAARAAGSAARG